MGARRKEQKTAKVRGRAAIVTAIITVIREDWRNGVTPTIWAHEGTIIAALRSGLCLSGMGWKVADTMAREVMAEAAQKAGAKRPTWSQGQREYTEGGIIRETRQRCANCERPLEEGQKTFCGKLCHDALRARQYYQDNLDKMQIVNRIKRVQRAANAEVYPRGERWKDARDKAIRNRA